DASAFVRPCGNFNPLLSRLKEVYPLALKQKPRLRTDSHSLRERNKKRIVPYSISGKLSPLLKPIRKIRAGSSITRPHLYHSGSWPSVSTSSINVPCDKPDTPLF